MQPFLRFLPLFCVPLVIACSSNVDVFGTGGAGGEEPSGPSGPGVTSATGNPSTSPSTAVSGSTGASSSTGTPCNPSPSSDLDFDGFTPQTGDCNDCDALHSPNNLDIPGSWQDENCDGEVDEPLEPCDAMLAMDDEDPILAASAIGLCKLQSGANDWGLISAAWVLADGSPPPSDPTQLSELHLGHGLLDDFGAVLIPREGQRMLALSSAYARDATDPDYGDPSNTGAKGYTSAAPPGSPIPSVGCVGAQPGEPNDPIALEVFIRVPDNAQGFAFDSFFLATDWPAFVCTEYDDTFFALMAPPPLGSIGGQVAFSPDGSPISLNGAPFDVCSCPMPPCMAGGKIYACAQGDGALTGTGFETHAGTGWLTTAAPLVPGSTLQLRLGIYDAGDPQLGSTVLVDNFTWITSGGVVVSTTSSP